MALFADSAQLPPIATHNHQFTQPEAESALIVWEFLSLNAILKPCWIVVNLSVNSKLFYSHKVTKANKVLLLCAAMGETQHRDPRCTDLFF